jgi:hypothetical protein
MALTVRVIASSAQIFPTVLILIARERSPDSRSIFAPTAFIHISIRLYTGFIFIEILFARFILIIWTVVAVFIGYGCIAAAGSTVRIRSFSSAIQIRIGRRRFGIAPATLVRIAPIVSNRTIMGTATAVPVTGFYAVVVLVAPNSMCVAAHSVPIR